MTLKIMRQDFIGCAASSVAQGGPQFFVDFHNFFVDFHNFFVGRWSPV